MAGTIKSQISIELREAVMPVLAVMAKAHAANIYNQFSDFFGAVNLPDPEGFMDFGNGCGSYRGSNLLGDRHTTAEADAITAALKPVRDAIAAVKAHRPYVPLKKRLTPYVIKGTYDGPGGRPGFHPAPVRAAASHVAIDESITKAPYEVKGGRSNERTVKAQELNLAAQLAGNGFPDREQR